MNHQSPLTVGVVGANGQVGTELCFLLRRMGVDTIPIVRNTVGAATFNHYGFDVRVADVGIWSDAKESLSDLDIVVIAAFASPLSRGDFKPRQARTANEDLVKNSVRAARDGAKIVYFSSIAVFGEEIAVNDLWWYSREKRHIENIFKRECNRDSCDGYIYRIGLVLGETIDRTESIKEKLSTSDRIDVEADAKAPSNTVHTVTITDAVLACTRLGVQPGTYTIVNKPQWTWQQVFGYYHSAFPNVDVRFIGSQEGSDNSSLGKLIAMAADEVTGRKTELMSLGFLLPDMVNQFVFNKYLQKVISNEITEYEERFRFSKREFHYDTVPGPTIPNLEPTERRLDEVDYPPDVLRQDKESKTRL